MSAASLVLQASVCRERRALTQCLSWLVITGLVVIDEQDLGLKYKITGAWGVGVGGVIWEVIREYV